MTQMRLSPSGPPVELSDSPLDAIIGAYFVALNTEGVNNNPTSIGPSDGQTSVVLGRVGTDVPETAGNDAWLAVLPTMAEEAEAISFGAGKWLFEVTLCVGYSTTSPPTSTTGDVTASIGLVDVNDAEVFAIAGLPSAVPRAPAGVAGGTYTSTKIPIVVTITEDDIIANDNLPFRGFNLNLSRANAAGSGGGGSYGVNSGTLIVFRDTTVKVSRFR
jgi:hypothetical protein